jgi:hypothetical protein
MRKLDLRPYLVTAALYALGRAFNEGRIRDALHRLRPKPSRLLLLPTHPMRADAPDCPCTGWIYRARSMRASNRARALP